MTEWGSSWKYLCLVARLAGTSPGFYPAMSLQATLHTHISEGKFMIDMGHHTMPGIKREYWWYQIAVVWTGFPKESLEKYCRYVADFTFQHIRSWVKYTFIVKLTPSALSFWQYGYIRVGNLFRTLQLRAEQMYLACRRKEDMLPPSTVYLCARPFTLPMWTSGMKKKAFWRQTVTKRSIQRSLYTNQINPNVFQVQRLQQRLIQSDVLLLLFSRTTLPPLDSSFG